MGIDFVRSGLTISFNEHYGDYGTFMDVSRDPIYRTILNGFEELRMKDSVVINVSANVDNTEFQSELGFTRLNLDILTEVLNPYFENIEDYETCAKVVKLISDLQKN